MPPKKTTSAPVPVARPVISRRHAERRADALAHFDRRLASVEDAIKDPELKGDVAENAALLAAIKASRAEYLNGHGKPKPDELEGGDDA